MSRAALSSSLALFLSIAACGGQQPQRKPLELRLLEEAKAHEILSSALAAGGYAFTTDVQVQLANTTSFACDFRAEGKRFAVEYITNQDRLEMGAIPPAAPGSRLHVVPAKTVSPDPAVAGESLYVFFIDEADYRYQHNPTSENRGDVTIIEVESRLRRDLTDFLSWYENAQAGGQ